MTSSTTFDLPSDAERRIDWEVLMEAMCVVSCNLTASMEAWRYWRRWRKGAFLLGTRTLLGAPGIATRSKKLTLTSCPKALCVVGRIHDSTLQLERVPSGASCEDEENESMVCPSEEPYLGLLKPLHRFSRFHH